MLRYMMMLGFAAKMKLNKLLADEKGAVDIVAIVILIGIAVTLALVFKKQIEQLLTALFGSIIPKAKNAVEGT